MRKIQFHFSERNTKLLVTIAAGLLGNLLAYLSSLLTPLNPQVIFDFSHLATFAIAITFGPLYGALAAAVVSAWSLVGTFSTRFKGSRRVFIFSFFGLALSLLIIGVCLYWVLMARHVPSIHDITTDTVNPPRFAAILPLRQNATNSPIYGGPLVAARQSAAYPDVKPLLLPIPPAQAFTRALATARKIGWEIVQSNASEGRIEAIDTTFWFGFKDDIVIRVAPTDQGSRIDMRSVSRVGQSDLGTNAARIRNYLKQLAVSSTP